MTRRQLRATLAACLVAIPGVLLAMGSGAEEKVKLTGTFSTLRFHSEAGDLLGEEIRIVYTTDGYQGMLQMAEGEPSEVYLFPVDITDSKLSFRVKGHGIYAGRFKGTIDSKGLQGTLSLDGGGKIELRLPREKSYWD